MKLQDFFAQVFPQPRCHAPDAVERSPRVLLVEQPHQQEVLCFLLLRMVIVARARQPKQFALPGYCDFGMIRIDPLSAVLSD